MSSKHYANRGVERNKKPLKNIVYEIELSKLENVPDKAPYSEYRFKDLGYLVLYWWHEEKNPIKNMHGFITAEYLKNCLGEKQYSKFCQGKRTFTIQRRINGKNKPMKGNK